MDKSLELTVRMGNYFKVQRIIKNKDDANRALETVCIKLNQHDDIDGIVNWRVTSADNKVVSRWSHCCNDKISIDIAILTFLEAINPVISEEKRKPELKYGSFVKLSEEITKLQNEIAMVVSAAESAASFSEKPFEKQNDKMIPVVSELAGEICADAGELLTICYLLQQAMLRSREFWEKDNQLVPVILDPVLDTNELLEGRIFKILDKGESICRMLDAA